MSATGADLSATAGAARPANGDTLVTVDDLSVHFPITSGIVFRHKIGAERTVVWRHIMRNSWSPIITLLGLDFGWFLGGVLVIEVVFGIPGIGWQAWNSIQTQDLAMIMGTVLFAAVLVTVSNLVVDVAYT